ncbi:MAG: DUF4956 domain-containing protein [Frankiaceae bacterium]|nr:DUF4956 domain-containing protein [Frankiaceae bacterium]
MITALTIPSTAVPSLSVAEIATILGGTFGLCLVIAWIYKGTHRGLSYSQSFQFSLVIIGMLSAAVMMVARVGILNALGILGVFALVRFRTIVKDTKDMAYVLFVLVIGLAMGTKEYSLALLTTGAVGLVVLVLTRLNFGVSKRHDSVLRVTNYADDGTALDAATVETALRGVSDSFSLLSANVQGGQVELTYGVRPKRSTTATAVLQAITQLDGADNVELFDTKHQVEF